MLLHFFRCHTLRGNQGIKITDYNGGGKKLFLNNGHALSGTTNHERIHLVVKFFHIKIYRP